MADPYRPAHISIKLQAHMPSWFLQWAWRYVDRSPHPSTKFICFMAKVLVRVEVV